MRNTLILCAALGGIAVSTGAFALPRTALAASGGIVQVRTVCDQDGNCWRETTPAEGIIGGVLGGMEGRSVHRDDDRDRHMDRHMERDHDEGEGEGGRDFR
jgi:hypothetical protein